MESPCQSVSLHCDRRLVVCCFDSTAVQTANREIEHDFRLAQNRNRAATPPPPITQMVSVHDVGAQSLHLLLVHRLDYRPRRAPVVRNVVVFSEPDYTASRTDRLQLATPAYYRQQEGLKPGIGDPHDGTLTKDGVQWASAIAPAGRVNHAELSFVSSREPWVYCAAHYQWDRELRRLKSDFAEEYGYTAAVRIHDPNAFATRLGIDFALSLDRKTDIKTDVLGEITRALSRYGANLSQGTGTINTVVRVYHGPVHYEDSSDTPRRSHAERLGRPIRWPAGVVHEEDLLPGPKRIPLRRIPTRRPCGTETLPCRVARATRTHPCPMSPW